MSQKDYIRSAAQVHAGLEELPDGRVIAKKEVKIYCPYRYIEKSFITKGEVLYILGIYGITCEDKYYAVSLIPAMVPIAPSITNRAKIEGDDYFEFVFREGDTVFKDTSLLRSDTLIYPIYEEFLGKGYIPWFIKYDELGKIFDNAKEFANSSAGKNHQVTQLIASILARDPKDRTKYYRTSVTTKEDVLNIDPVFVPLKSVEYSATSTLTKLAGSYFQKGVVSALINPSSREETLDTLLRA